MKHAELEMESVVLMENVWKVRLLLNAICLVELFILEYHAKHIQMIQMVQIMVNQFLQELCAMIHVKNQYLVVKMENV